MSTPRPKLFVAKCHCGCDMWAAFKTHRLTRDEHGRYREQGMYEVTWRQALRNAIQWTAEAWPVAQAMIADQEPDDPSSGGVS